MQDSEHSSQSAVQLLLAQPVLMENLRKARIELEVKVKQLEVEKAESEKQKSQQDALVEKLQKKVDKYKESWAAHSVSAESGCDLAR